MIGIALQAVFRYLVHRLAYPEREAVPDARRFGRMALNHLISTVLPAILVICLVLGLLLPGLLHSLG